MREPLTALGTAAAAALLLSAGPPAVAAAPTVSVESVEVAYGGPHLRIVFCLTCPEGEDHLLVDTSDQDEASGYDGRGVPCTVERQTLSTTVFAQDGACSDTGSAHLTHELTSTFGDVVSTEEEDVTVEHGGSCWLEGAASGTPVEGWCW